MRSIGKLPFVLFFINGTVPTEAQAEEAASVRSRATVAFRNAHLVDGSGAEALEECDGVMGEVPPRYAAIYPESFGDVSGIGAFRTVHAGEPGVGDHNVASLDSRHSGDVAEEERKRAYRGPSINEPFAKPVFPSPASISTVAGTGEQISPGGSGPVSAGTPLGIAGAAHVVPTTMQEGASVPGAAAPVGSWGAPVSSGGATSGGGDGDGLDKMTREELNAEATEAGLDPTTYATKADVIKAIRENRS